MKITLCMEEEYQRWTREISMAKAAIAQGPSDQDLTEDESSFDMRYERTYCVPYEESRRQVDWKAFAWGFFAGVVYSLSMIGVIIWTCGWMT